MTLRDAMNPVQPAPVRLRLFSLLRSVTGRFEAWTGWISDSAFRGLFPAVYGNRIRYINIAIFEREQRRGGPLVEDRIRLTIIVVTYRQPGPLECLLASLGCQTLQNFDIVVVHDGPDAETRSVVERFESRWTERIHYIETPVRHNDYGHSLRQIGIEAATGEFLLITNGDNYYVPRFTEFLFEALDTYDLDMAAWDLIHSHTYPGETRLLCYSPFRVYPVRYMVDIGSIVVRTELAKRVGFADHSHDGDARYVEDLLTLAENDLRIGKIQKTLMVHN